MSHRYDSSFFDYVNATSGRSAAALLGRIDLGLSPHSVLDVGCGRGIWLAAWKARGVARVLGLDGEYVDQATLKVAPSEFRPTDLAKPFALGERFDVVQCLEVAEHLPATSADALVESLVLHGDVILFSAAPPGQGGEHHVNEQPLRYWADRFAAHGYALFDCVRPAVRGVKDVEPWYRFNTVLFANAAGAERLSPEVRATRSPAGAELPSFAPLAWRVRCAILRLLPRPVIEALARLQHALE